jgi:adenylate kinase family enzyme
MRVVVLGNSGSGKSTLARWLGRAGISALDLDTVAWKPGQIAVSRPDEVARRDVEAFCSENASWVVEGCYTFLAEVALAFTPRLIFLNPGVERCLANCRERPWEPHKYASKAEQDRHLGFLLSWVRDYYSRGGDMSLRAHQACFERYSGPKIELTEFPELAPRSELLSWLEED